MKIPAKTKNNSNKNKFFYFPYVLILSAMFSVFLVYNASSTYAYNNFGNSYYFLINQSIWFTVSLFVFFILQKLKVSLIEKNLTIIFFVTVFLLVLVVLPTPFSLNIYGARRWLILNPMGVLPEVPFMGRLTLQPSELFKFVLCLFLPKVLLNNLRLGEKKAFLKSLLYLGIPAFLVLIEPDLKDFIILVLIGISILFVSNINLKYFLSGVPIILVLFVLLILVAPYRFERLKTYIGGGTELGSSYHVKQINIALGSGGVFGVGIGRSVQKNEYLPEVMGDSIFAVYAEEFGFLGSVTLILLILLLIYTLYKMFMAINSVYYSLYSVGIFTWISTQSVINLGSISGLIPLTGVPLPLISYGGSSLVFTIAGLSLAYRFYKEDLKRV